MAGDKQVDGVVNSLFDLCISVIISSDELLNANYLKDLPKHILEEIICRLCPFYLENIENEEFLSEKGISTVSLWESHYSLRWKYVMTESNYSGVTESHVWRALYFQRHFHELINNLARARDSDYATIVRGSRERLLMQLCKPWLTVLEQNSESIHDMVDLCVKHLTRLRLYNAACLFLERRRDILRKIARSIVYLEVHHLRDSGMKSLSKILPLFHAHQLMSFSLNSCKVENEGNFRVLLMSLCKSWSTERETFQCYTERACEGRRDGESSRFYDCKFLVEHDQLNPGPNSVVTTAHEFRKCNNFSKQDNSTSEFLVSYGKNLLSNSSFENRGGDIGPGNNEDDLYEDIFSGNLKLVKFDNTSGSPDGVFNSFHTTSEPFSEQYIGNFSAKNNHIEPCRLTELELVSCLMSPMDLKALSETLGYFSSLCTLRLNEAGSGFYPEMSDLICSIGDLVMNRLLSCLDVENNTLDDRHGMMFCRMIFGSCQKCSGHSCKGLRSLRLVGSRLGQPTADHMFQKLTACSHCEHLVLPSWRYVTTPERDTRPVDIIKSQSIWLVDEHHRKEASNDMDHHCNFPTRSGATEVNSNSFKTEDNMICTGIECLYLTANLARGGATSLASSLFRNRSLQSISLPSCGLSTDDVAATFDSISGHDHHRANNTIKKLDLRENSFEPSAGGSLCNLINRSQLVYLDLSFCGFEVIPEDVILALCSNDTLEVLKIAGNRLGDDGAAAITQVFKTPEKKSMLMSLDLSYNRITASSLLHLGKTLTQWPRKLKEISIKGNLLNHSLDHVKMCLRKVFDVVITENFSSSMAFVDHVSEM